MTRINIVILFGLICIVILSGCTEEMQTVKYSNDVISIEEYYVSNLKPYAGSATTLSFFIQNNGEEPIPRVEVNFFDVYGFEILELKCQGTQPDEEKKICIFDSSNSYGELEPHDVRQITLTLKAPHIKKESKFTLSYYVNYSYSGFKKADIPVIDGETRTKPTGTFSESSATYGPIQLNFQPPVGGVRKEDGKEIKEYWSVQGRPFEVKMSFIYASDLRTKKTRNVVIKSGDVNLTLKGPIERAKNLYCDFCGADDPDCPITSDNNLYSKKAIKIPSTLKCNFESLQKNLPPEVTATLWVEFSYTYEFIKTETFTVKPLTE